MLAEMTPQQMDERIAAEAIADEDRMLLAYIGAGVNNILQGIILLCGGEPKWVEPGDLVGEPKVIAQPMSREQATALKNRFAAAFGPKDGNDRNTRSQPSRQHKSPGPRAK